MPFELRLTVHGEVGRIGEATLVRDCTIQFIPVSFVIYRLTSAGKFSVVGIHGVAVFVRVSIRDVAGRKRNIVKCSRTEA